MLFYELGAGVALKDYLSSVQRCTVVPESDLLVMELVNMKFEENRHEGSFGELGFRFVHDL
jgi:hypothetical protein